MEKDFVYSGHHRNNCAEKRPLLTASEGLGRSWQDDTFKLLGFFPSVKYFVVRRRAILLFLGALFTIEACGSLGQVNAAFSWHVL